MKNMQMLLAINDIRDDYILDAEIKTQIHKLTSWKTAGIAAACALIVLALLGVGAIFFSPSNMPRVERPPVILPQREIGWGETSYFAYQISDLICKDDVDPQMFDTLPVFANPLNIDPDGNVVNPDTAQMHRLLLDTAERLNMNKDAADVKEVLSDENKLCAYTVADQNYQIEVNTGLGVTVTICNLETVQSLQLPQKATKKAFEKHALASINQFRGLLDMHQPKIVFPRGEYTVYGEQMWTQFSVYDNTDNPLNAFLNKYFRTVTFYFDETNHQLSAISLRHTDLSNRTDGYPVQSLEKAKTNLCEALNLKRSAILHTEIFYENSSNVSVFTPYYRFFVQTDDTNIAAYFPGMHTYTAYEMSALDPAYVVTE